MASPFLLLFLCIGFAWEASLAFEGGSRTNSTSWQLDAPWTIPRMDTSGVSIQTNLPIASSDPLGNTWGKGSNPRLVNGKESIHGISMPQVDAIIPVSFDGALLFGWHPKASLDLRSAWSLAEYNYSDSSSTTQLSLHGTMNSSAAIKADWSSLYFGYRIVGNSRFSMSLGVQHHTVHIQASGKNQGEFLVDLSQQSASGDPTEWEQITSQWNTDQFNSEWQGNYSGNAWRATLEIHAGPFIYQGQMGGNVKLDGSFRLAQDLPFFMDSLNLAISQDSLGAWIQPTRVDAIRGTQTSNHEFVTTAPMRFSIPQSHMIGIVPAKWFALDYTWTSGPYSLRASEDSLESRLDFRRLAEKSFSPNHLVLSHIKLRSFQMDAGGYWMNSLPRPVLSSAVFIRTLPIIWTARFDLFPWIRLFGGIQYAL
jgi:hypothetical protein